jgi:hypothetical protein
LLDHIDENNPFELIYLFQTKASLCYGCRTKFSRETEQNDLIIRHYCGSIVLFHLLSCAKCRFPLPSVFVVLPVVKCLLTLEILNIHKAKVSKPRKVGQTPLEKNTTDQTERQRLLETSSVQGALDLL